MPQVSVISIFYNAERFFAAAIESVLGQTFSDFELLLADDGSCDASTGIARRYAARFPDRVRYLCHPGRENRGMSATRNLGLRAAEGEFVAFIDADDVWRPEKLREQIEIARQCPELGMICGAVNYWRSWESGEDCIVPTGHAQDRVVRPPEASLALYPLGSAAAPCPSDLLLRRSVVQEVGGFESHFTGPRMMYEDQGFLAKLYLVAPVWFDSRIWLDYRQHETSCVSEVTKSGNYHAVRRYFLEWFETYLADHPHPAVEKAAARALRPYRRPLLDGLLTMPARVRSAGRRALDHRPARATR